MFSAKKFPATNHIFSNPHGSKASNTKHLNPFEIDIKTLSDSRPAQAEPPSPEMTMASPPDLNSASAPRIRNPRRLLILSPSSHSTSTIPSFLHSLTETPVADPPASFAGYTTHPLLRLTNRYYTADIPIWVDEIPLQTATDERTRTQTAGEGESAAPPSPAQWAVEFSGEDARVVRDAIGALVICIRNLEDRSASLPAGAGTGTDAGAGAGAGSPESRNDVKSLKEFLAAVGRVKGVIEEERAEVGDVPVLLVLVGGPRGHNGARVRGEEGDLEELDGESVEPFSVGWWEDQLFEMGMVGVEVLEWDPTGEEGEERNVYGGLSFSKDIVDQCGLMLWQNTRVCGALGKSWRRMTGLRRLRMRLRVGLAAMVSKSIFWDWIVGRTGLILRSTSWNERCWG